MVSALLTPLLGLINGPVFSIIDKLVPDAALKARLKAQIQAKVLDNSEKLATAQRDVVLREISGSTLTRSWRPVLMYVIILFLFVYGLILPFVDLAIGRQLPFHPRWNDIPDGLWNLLSLGLGGYIGGRSVEKVARSLQLAQSDRATSRKFGIKRRNNFNKK